MSECSHNLKVTKNYCHPLYYYNVDLMPVMTATYVCLQLFPVWCSSCGFISVVVFERPHFCFTSGVHMTAVFVIDYSISQWGSLLCRPNDNSFIHCRWNFFYSVTFAFKMSYFAPIPNKILAFSFPRSCGQGEPLTSVVT